MWTARDLRDPHLDLDIARQAIRARLERAAHPRSPIASELPDLRVTEVALELEALLFQEPIDREPEVRDLAGDEPACLEDPAAEQCIDKRAVFLGDQRTGARLGAR